MSMNDAVTNSPGMGWEDPTWTRRMAAITTRDALLLHREYLHRASVYIIPAQSGGPESPAHIHLEILNTAYARFIQRAVQVTSPEIWKNRTKYSVDDLTEISKPSEAVILQVLNALNPVLIVTALRDFKEYDEQVTILQKERDLLIRRINKIAIRESEDEMYQEEGLDNDNPHATACSVDRTCYEDGVGKDAPSENYIDGGSINLDTSSTAPKESEDPPEPVILEDIPEVQLLLHELLQELETNYQCKAEAERTFFARTSQNISSALDRLHIWTLLFPWVGGPLNMIEAWKSLSRTWGAPLPPDQRGRKKRKTQHTLCSVTPLVEILVLEE